MSTLPTATTSQCPFTSYTHLPALESGIQLFDIPLNAENDDDLHRPVDLLDEDGEEMQVERCVDLCSWWGMLNLGALVLMTLGVVGVFVGVPIVAFLGRAGGG